ncbi:glutathione peroxidase [Rubellimicrobium sp. CFH 75288]|nr:glutathione peroxidase [Rubellimicrobium sp. CFH 75288]NAZ36675.1 glutathione peroxidase [Rubellimicrobium sp. CFH 75288]
MFAVIMLLGAAVGSLGPAAPARAERSILAEFRFGSIDGGEMGFADWAGRPVLLANTASLCGYTWQYAQLQALFDAYGPRGLVVVAIPSNSFNQELGSDREVRDFCQLNYGLDLPITTVTPVRGPDAHPFYAWLREETGFVPRWNFNKVLIGRDGSVLGTWGSAERPTGRAITAAVEAALAEAPRS